MKKISFLLLVLTITFASSAQISIDSLQNALANEKKDTATLSRYYKVMNALPSQEMTVALLIANWVCDGALKAKDYKLYTTTRLAMAGLYHFTNDFIPAIKYYVETQAAAEKYDLPELRLETMNNLANVYYLTNQYDKAEEIYFETIEGCKKLGIIEGVIAGYGSLGTIYYKAGGDDTAKKRKAISYMRMAVDAGLQSHDTIQMIRSYSSVGKMYAGVGEFDSAMYCLNTAESMMKAKKGSREGFAYHYYHRGSALLQMKDYKGAIQSLLVGLPYAEEANSPLWVSSHYDGLSKAYKGLGDYKKALEYGEKHFKIEDSILNADNFAKAADIQNIYERKRKDEQLIQKDVQLEVASGKRTRLATLLISSLAVLAILAVFAFVLMKHIGARKKAYSELEEKSIKIQEQALELSKQAKLIAKFQSQMNPHFVFNALHNIQGLVISNENQKATHQIQSLAQLMRKTFANAEKDDIPLEEEISYLQKYIDFEKNAFDNKLDFEIKTDEKVENVLIPPMMIQPFVENAIKHAELRKVDNPYIKVLIEIENNLLSISVRDNGKGIRKDETTLDILSHSMTVIKARIQLLFQEKNKPVNENLFSVKTVPDIDRGTVVKFYLPLTYAY